MAGTCPFQCGYKNHSEYAIQLHIEEHHTEDSPWVINSSAPDPPRLHKDEDDSSPQDSASEENPWIKCTRPNCGNYFSIADMDLHYELHEQEERLTSDSAGGEKASNKLRKQARSPTSTPTKPDQRSPRKDRQLQNAESTMSRGNRSLLEYFSGGSSARRPPLKPHRIKQPREPGRLGKRELGPHAFEKRMPEDVRRRLLRDAEPYYENRIGRDGKTYRQAVIRNETSGLIPLLARLCDYDDTNTVTYLCDSAVRHVEKLRCDGNFCGYWNIQMLLTYLRSRQNDRDDAPRPLPTIIDIQTTIEKAWDAGICSYGRVQTGGILNTRKWIGTHEALVYFLQTGFPVEAMAFSKEEVFDDKGNLISSTPAFTALLDYVEAYFISSSEGAENVGTSYITSLPPLYFQRFGHSMTIVGLERKEDGSRQLLVFDPSFGITAQVKRFLEGKKASASLDTILKAYRRSDVALSRWDEFEIVVPTAVTNSTTMRTLSSA